MKRAKIIITFQRDADATAVCIPMFGGTYNNAAGAARATRGQIAYRTKLARQYYGLQKGVGFAKLWRDGTSPLWQQTVRKLMPSVRAKVMRDLSVWRARPTAEVKETR